jgi:hypothetical protein
MTVSQRFISGFVDLTQGLAKLLTLGIVSIHWSDKYVKSTIESNRYNSRDLFSLEEI